MRDRLSEAETSYVRWCRVARLATVDPEGMPHVVPVCPVLDGEEVVFASDPTAKLRFLGANPRCALVFDEYSRTGACSGRSWSGAAPRS